MQTPKTKVIFRFWQGSVIALFPELAADMNPAHCLSFQHVGQHGAADPLHIIANSKPATDVGVRTLRSELESLPYEYELEVVYRHTQAHYETRRRDIEGGQGL